MHQDALPGAWMAFTLGTLCIENNTFPWLFACNLALLTFVLHSPSIRRGGLFFNWARSQGPHPRGLATRARRHALNRGAVLDALLWIPKPTWETLRSTIAAVYLFRISDLVTYRLLPTLVSGFGAVIAWIALLGAWRLRRDPPLLAAIGLALAAMPLTI